MKKFKINRTVILGILLLMAVVSKAQQSRIEAAVAFLQQDKLDSAKANINRAIANSETANEAQTWYYRGFIYKTIYNKTEKGNKQSPARIESLNSFKKSLSLDASKEFFTDNVKGIKYLVNTIYSDAGDALDPIDYKTAIVLFEQFKEYFKIVDPSPEIMQQKEIEFDLALASVYSKIIESDKKAGAKFVNPAKNLYLKVLALDPNNISANYNMGILFYNQAVNLIKEQEYDLDIVNLDGVLDNSVKLFKESLPFMEKAYSLDPKRAETITGLTGIYTVLHEEEKIPQIQKPK